ncbi:hypothetical protein [Streptosporangium sp. OZ121]|uniref:hypothetical protein n=1 Tax=Streptosporangium sp. OZ121 TaxID=3444183 RepID=UPI003F7B17E2
MRKRSNAVTLGALTALSAMVIAGCAIEGEVVSADCLDAYDCAVTAEEEVTADCVDIYSLAEDGSYQQFEDRYCEGGSHHGYTYVYGGSSSGGRIHGATSIRPSNVKITSRAGRVIVSGGFGGRGGGGGS